MTATAVEAPTLDFAAGLPGFPAHHRFVLTTLDEDGVLFALRSVDQDGLRLFVVPPGAFFPDYAPEIDDATVERLDLQCAEEAQLFVVVTPGPTADASTANLFAPLVVNTRTHAAAQVVLTGSGYPLRATLAG